MIGSRTAVLVLLAASLALVAAGPAGAQSLTPIDEDHELVEPASIDQFEEDGVANATIEVPQTRLTVATDSEDTALEGLYVDQTKRYLQVEYDEDLERTLRIKIPSEYWHPIVAKIDAENADVTADMAPSESGRHTIVTMTVDEPTTATFVIPIEARGTFWTRDKTRDVINETLGYEPPRLAARDEWQYIEPDRLEQDDTVPLDSSDGLTLQYDAAYDETGENPDWHTVPKCSRSEDAVCRYSVAGKQDQTMVLVTTDTAPRIRYKAVSDASSGIWASMRELRSIPGEAIDDLHGLVGGDS